MEDSRNHKALEAADHIPNDIIHDFQQALHKVQVAQARFQLLGRQDQHLCLHWIADAPSVLLWPLRIRTIVALLNDHLPDPPHELGVLTLHELCALYGQPQLLSELSPEAQDHAIKERRVLQAYTINASGGNRVITRICEPQHNRTFGLLEVFPHPCQLTGELVQALNYNPWTSESEMAAALEPCGHYLSEEALLQMIEESHQVSEVQAYLKTLPPEIYNIIIGRCIRLRGVLLADDLLKTMNEPESEREDDEAERWRTVQEQLEEERQIEKQLTALIQQMNSAQQLAFKKELVQQALDGLLVIIKGNSGNWWVVEVTREWLDNPTEEIAQRAIQIAQFERHPGGVDYYNLRTYLHPIAVMEAGDAQAAAEAAFKAVSSYVLSVGKSEATREKAEDKARRRHLQTAQEILNNEPSKSQ